MVNVQKRLEKGLLILADEVDVEQKQQRLYQECLYRLSHEGIPQVLHRDYYQLLVLANLPVNRQILVGQEASRDIDTLLPVALLMLYKRLTEWIAIETYLRNQRHAYR